MKKYFIKSLIIVTVVCIALSTECSTAQTGTLSGKITFLNNQEISLKGYNLLEEVTLATTMADSLGRFTLTPAMPYRGAAMLYGGENPKVLLIIDDKNITLSWDDATSHANLKISGEENSAFEKAMQVYQNANAKLAGLNYILPLYEKEPAKHKFLAAEIDTVNLAYHNFTQGLPKNLYTANYLQWRGLVSDMPQTAKQYPWRLQKNADAFKAIDFADPDLLTSGLYKELIEGITHLTESYGKEQQQDKLIPVIENVVNDLENAPGTLTKVSGFWFTILEQMGLSKPAAYLARYMMASKTCTPDEKLMDRFEQYGKMAVGNKAPNINLPLNNSLLLPRATTLSKLKDNYKLVIFGASWCPNCQDEYPQLMASYKDLKEKYKLEIVYIALDTDKDAYSNFYKDAPFITVFGGEGWETKAAKEYYVFATPTMFLLDKSLKILYKPNTLTEAIDWLSKDHKK